MVTMDSVRQIARGLLETAKMILATDPEGVTPVTFVFNHDGHMIIIATPFTQNTKEKVLAKLRGIVEKMKPAAVVRINDVWMSHCGPNQPPILPARDPDRREALLVGIRCGEQEEYWAVNYTRDADNRPVFQDLQVLNGDLVDRFWHPEAPSQTLL